MYVCVCVCMCVTVLACVYVCMVCVRVCGVCHHQIIIKFSFNQNNRMISPHQVRPRPIQSVVYSNANVNKLVLVQSIRACVCVCVRVCVCMSIVVLHIVEMVVVCWGWFCCLGDMTT